MSTWASCKNVLCVRLDNMGDVLMSAPAMTALKETFGCSITLLTSSMGKGIAPYIPAVDKVITMDVPWMKSDGKCKATGFREMTEALQHQNFDAAVIFTVFSQNPLPAALMVSLAGIQKTLAYCRENPYELLSDWVPEEEPYQFVRHQVRRDLDLVKTIGARSTDERIRIHIRDDHEESLKAKLFSAGIDVMKPWLIMHPGVSEIKRQYPADDWIEAGKKIATEMQFHIIVTGSSSEKKLADKIRDGIGDRAHSLAGALSLEEFITLIRLSPLLISVNTGSVHIAAAVNTKIIVLYALTNPQHAPWKSIGKVLPFPVAEQLQSRNQVLQFVAQKYFSPATPRVHPQEIFEAAYDLLINKNEPQIEEIIAPSSGIASGQKQNFKLPGTIKFPEE